MLINTFYFKTNQQKIFIIKIKFKFIENISTKKNKDEQNKGMDRKSLVVHTHKSAHGFRDYFLKLDLIY